MRGTKATLFMTGGGPSQKSFEPSSDLEAQLFRVIEVSVEGIYLVSSILMPLLVSNTMFNPLLPNQYITI